MTEQNAEKPPYVRPIFCKRCKGMGLVQKTEGIERDDKGREVERKFSFVRCPDCNGRGTKR